MSCKFRLSLVAVLIAGVAACSSPPPPAPPPPPPPPPKIVIPTPPRPLAPNNAPDNLPVPALGADGLRESVNRNITPAQTLWNLRSAFNVAALNCRADRHADIVVAYRAFLKANAKKLVAVNKTVDSEFKAKYGAGFVRPRELYMTAVYNHFALPPVQDEFCDAVQAVNRDMTGVKSKDMDAFAARSLPNIEIVYDNFYRRYDEYRVALADWRTKYKPYEVPGAQAYQPAGQQGPTIGAAPVIGSVGSYGPAASTSQGYPASR
ncbi:MAG: hypothetical protein KGN34_18525 [Sphingomonadales bacterium]|nr:hypothetical protein [Sphingomonadales bacterium]